MSDEYTRERPRGLVQAPVRPIDADGINACIVGTIVWAVAGVLLWINGDALRASGHAWWQAVCVVGVLIGLCLTCATIRKRCIAHRERTRGR